MACWLCGILLWINSNQIPEVDLFQPCYIGCTQLIVHLHTSLALFSFLVRRLSWRWKQLILFEQYNVLYWFWTMTFLKVNWKNQLMPNTQCHWMSIMPLKRNYIYWCAQNGNPSVLPWHCFLMWSLLFAIVTWSVFITFKKKKTSCWPRCELLPSFFNFNDTLPKHHIVYLSLYLCLWIFSSVCLFVFLQFYKT